MSSTGSNSLKGITPQLSDKFELVMNLYNLEMSISELDIDIINQLCDYVKTIEYNLKDNIVECEFKHILGKNIEPVIEHIAKFGVEQLIIKPKEIIDDSNHNLFIACMFGKCIYHNCVYDATTLNIVAHEMKFQFFTIKHIHKNTIFNNDSLIGRLLNSLKDLYILQNC